jgi:pyruvate kinase
MTDCIVTMPPYAPWMDDILAHPIVSGIRLNTVMPIDGKETIDEQVARLVAATRRRGKRLIVDLKGRQLRLVEPAQAPYTPIVLSHRITVETPAIAYFRDGLYRERVLGVDGNKLIMESGPQCELGRGESVNIPHPSLRIDGYLTRTDEQYAQASRRHGVQDIMLSFVEGTPDIAELLAIHPNASPIAKIESRKGLAYVRAWNKESRLMAARGDLYYEVDRPHLVLGAVEDIVRTDPRAILASRILSSLRASPEPSCADLADIENALRTGYRTFMLGDEICQREQSALSAVNIIEAVARDYERRHPGAIGL